MSSRALRKLQREQEEKNQLETLTKQNDEDEEEEEEEEEKLAPKALNAFDMLNRGEENDSISPVASDFEEQDVTGKDDKSSEKPVASDKSKSKKPKKKKNKNKGKSKETTEVAFTHAQPAKNPSQLDEIDLALQSLSTYSKSGPAAATGSTIDEANVQLYRLLAVESKHLNALNEMKRLFGNVVTENDEEGGPAPRRRGRGPQQVDLGGALAARNSPIARGQGLRALALRRNPFIMGKEEWPQARSGGLGMEMVETMEDGTVEYRYVHNTFYQDLQRQFESCVESMDPQRMISMLQYNPYHISTLLQVSEIAKQQGDHSVSGDLLERALFTFGRSVQSSFTTAISEGKARLDFRRPENREFWLAAWRYMMNLGQRGTWRTAYEWVKLILSLDPEGDPYCVALIIDQLALRGGQSEHFLQLSQCPFFGEDLWAGHHNIQISSALAQYRLKEPQKCRATLTKTISTAPWIFSRLFQELNISHIPKSIWGSAPRSDREKFDCEAYVYNAKDLWSTPEAISLLVEVAETAPTTVTPPASNMPITLDEARHMFLSGVPSLINLIPRHFTNMPTTSSDPLPPPDSLLTYDPVDHEGSSIPTGPDHEHEEPPPAHEADGQPPAQTRALQNIQALVTRLLPWLRNPAATPDQGRNDPDIQEVARAAGIPRENVADGLNELRDLLSSGADTNELRAALRQPGGDIPGGYQTQTEEDAMGWNEGMRAAVREPGADIPEGYHIRPEEHDPSWGERFGINEGNNQASQSPENQDSMSPSEQRAGPEPYDEDRNKRWLAGQGLIRLRDFTTANGTDEKNWPADAGREIVSEYASRVVELEQRKTRDFIMDYVLRQGTSPEVKELVERQIKRVGK